MFSEFLEPAVAENNTVRALRVKQNSKEQKLTIKLYKAERSCSQVIILCRFITTMTSHIVI